MKKITKRIGVLLMSCSMVFGMAQPTFAGSQTKTIYKNNGTGYDVFTVTISTGPSNNYKRIATPGFEKKSYTTGTISVSSSKSVTHGSSSSLSATTKFGLSEIVETSFSYNYTVSDSVTAQISAGTSITVDKTAPSGFYYGFVGILNRKVKIKHQRCTYAYSGWYQVQKDQNLKYAPVENSDYITVMTMDDYYKKTAAFEKSIK